MKSILSITALTLLFISCTKTSLTSDQTWQVTLGASLKSENSECHWTKKDSIVTLIFTTQNPKWNFKGTVYVYHQTADSSYYWMYKNRIN